MGEYGREQRNQQRRAVASSEKGSKQLKEFVDNRSPTIQCAPPKLGSLPLLSIPQTETQENFRSRYPNSGFASNLATATNWGRNIGGKWAITGSMAVALHSLKSKIPGKVIPVDDLDIIDGNLEGSLVKASEMEEYYEVFDFRFHSSGNQIGDKVAKTSIDVLPEGGMFGNIGEPEMIYGLPVVSIASLKDKYSSSSRDKDIPKIGILDKI
ncbi:hypothetical protein [uncultured Bacteroides sp.]|uniref:hypothetical protein n=1 Tax=uncultured Bacteroides sp. TaxID=162156 RepID=UPI0025E90071|nr:hypothetical protein [uncultured Bacteroides sp.]